ncbi:MAG: PD40 domain-containing protein [Desulfovibrionaceae bacterium]|nr:PD40 domain-containing protein [Desulfovibrionaceae bacterium]
MSKTFARLIGAACLVLAGISFFGQARASGALTVDIHGPGQRTVNMVVLPQRAVDGRQAAPLAADLDRELRRDLSLLPFLRLMPVSELLGGDPSKGVEASDIDFKPLSLARADLVMTAGWSGDEVQVRVFETFGGRRVIGKAYAEVTAKTVPRVADRVCSLLLEALTGKKGFFESPIAFVRKTGSGKEIYKVLPQGRDLEQVTRAGGYNLGPDWSKDGRYIVFSHLGDDRHTLGLWDGRSGEVSFKAFAGNTVISPAFASDGEIAVTLDLTGAPDIYLLDRRLEPVKPLVRSWAIDVSPSFDRAGRKMAFTSGRVGSPQIFLLEIETGLIQRVTFEGSYNTNPCLSPDGRYVVFSRSTNGGHRIFLHDLATGAERQLTFGPGSDEDPAFGPDGYFVAFSSSREGGYKIYLTTRHGDDPVRVDTGRGQAFAPAWGVAAPDH